MMWALDTDQLQSIKTGLRSRRQSSNSKTPSKERTRQVNQTATSQFGVESSASSAPAPSTLSSPPASAPSAPESLPTPDQSAQQQFGLP